MNMPVASVTLAAASAGSGANAMLAVHLNLLQAATAERDKRLVVRVLHYLPQVRRQLAPATLAHLLGQCASGSALSAALALKIDAAGAQTAGAAPAALEKTSVGAAGEPYVCLLVGLHLMDTGRHAEVQRTTHDRR